MEKIYIIGRNDNEFIKGLELPIIELPIISTDEEIQDFIENYLLDLDFKRLIIPVVKEEDVKIGLRIGLHIRLTESLWEKRLIPILFVSAERLGTIIKDGGIYSNILATKGCKFEQYTQREIILKAISLLEGLRPNEFKNSFLEIIHILPDEKTGRHSLANQWGALALDKAANTKALRTDKELKWAEKQLYFKYVTALNFSYNKLETPKKQIIDLAQHERANKINAENYRILLIDDEANKGWGSVLQNVFKTSNSTDFQVIQEKVNTYETLSQSSKNLIENGNFDLFLIDLRLNGIEEENVTNPKDFSGTKILKGIKQLNEGNQVIMFTASNKAWNMKVLLDEGADGYYIKESPEYNFSLDFSKENYSNLKNEVLKCFQLSFLRKIANIHKSCNSVLNINSQFNNSAKASLDIAFELLKKSANNSKYFNLAYLTYYQILEDYVGQRENFYFDYNTGNAFIDTNVLVIDGHTKVWQLKFIKKGIERYDYFERGAESNDKNWSSLSQISFVLAFKFNKDNSYLQKWGRLNNLRNTKAGHGGSNGFITIEEIGELLEIVELFLTNQ